MKKILLVVCAFLSLNVFAGDLYKYKVDILNIKDDKVKVMLECPTIAKDQINFNFPKTIPGTYSTENYGLYIEKFKAKDKTGKALKAKKITENTWQISDAKNLASIEYMVNDSWDAGVKKDKIFEPAGTNIDAGKNVVMNNAGFFGYFDGMEKTAIEVAVTKPADFVGVSSLNDKIVNANLQVFNAESYHRLADCPILFAKPDTAQFMLGKTLVTIAVVNESGKPTAKKVYDEVRISLEAAQKFLGVLPVEKYSFLIFIKDYKAIMAEVQSGKMGFFKKLKMAKLFKGQGFGALEHDNSSLYFLPDFGNDEYIETLKDVCIHEFMHIITPLNLHSERIGDFNYIEPKMSKHLWLYEGITEYFAGQIQLKAQILSPDEYLKKIAKPKITEGNEFPNTMSYTEMSENVLVKPYKDQYNTVYNRGAMMGMLLDFEIMRLTNGEKTLRDVVLKLSRSYGPNKSFNEETFIDEFVAEVNPELKKFFTKYIMGKDSLDYTGGFANVGIDFQKQAKSKAVLNPVFVDDVKYKFDEGNGGYYTITAVGPNENLGLKKGDRLFNFFINPQLFKEGVNEGDEIEVSVIRGMKQVKVPYKAKMGDTIVKNLVNIKLTKTEKEKKMFDKWIN